MKNFCRRFIKDCVKSMVALYVLLGCSATYGDPRYEWVPYEEDDFWAQMYQLCPDDRTKAVEGQKRSMDQLKQRLESARYETVQLRHFLCEVHMPRGTESIPFLLPPGLSLPVSCTVRVFLRDEFTWNAIRNRKVLQEDVRLPSVESVSIPRWSNGDGFSAFVAPNDSSNIAFVIRFVFIEEAVAFSPRPTSPPSRPASPPADVSPIDRALDQASSVDYFPQAPTSGFASSRRAPERRPIDAFLNGINGALNPPLFLENVAGAGQCGLLALLRSLQDVREQNQDQNLGRFGPIAPNCNFRNPGSGELALVHQLRGSIAQTELLAITQEYLDHLRRLGGGGLDNIFSENPVLPAGSGLLREEWRRVECRNIFSRAEECQKRIRRAVDFGRLDDRRAPYDLQLDYTDMPSVARALNLPVMVLGSARSHGGQMVAEIFTSDGGTVVFGGDGPDAPERRVTADPREAAQFLQAHPESIKIYTLPGGGHYQAIVARAPRPGDQVVPPSPPQPSAPEDAERRRELIRELQDRGYVQPGDDLDDLSNDELNSILSSLS
jgi:hypothetical protein